MDISNVMKFRICLALGSIPPFIVMLSTWGEEESEEFKHANEAHVQRITGTSFAGVSIFSATRRSPSSFSGGEGHTSELSIIADPTPMLSGWACFKEHIRVGFEDPAVLKVNS